MRGSSRQTISLHPQSAACKAGSEQTGQKACIQTAKESSATVMHTYKLTRSSTSLEKAARWTECLQSCLSSPTSPAFHYFRGHNPVLIGFLCQLAWVSYHTCHKASLPPTTKCIERKSDCPSSEHVRVMDTMC